MATAVKYQITIHKGININDVEKLGVFGHGFFQDILTFMKHLGLQHITDRQVAAYRDYLVKPYTLKKSGRRHRFGTPIPGARPIGIKLRGDPCPGCKDKEK